MPAVSMDVMEEHVEEIMHFTGAVWKANVGDDPELVDRKVAPALDSLKLSHIAVSTGIFPKFSSSFHFLVAISATTFGCACSCITIWHVVHPALPQSM